MHASLILFIASLAASAVAAPMPIQAPAENLVIREAEVDSNSPTLDVLKREILERLDVTAQRSVPKAHHGYSGSVYDKRVTSSDDHDDDAAEMDDAGIDKRQSSKGYAGSVWDKRQSSKGYAGKVWDKRQSSKGYAGKVWDKRNDSSLGLGGAPVHDKRQSSEGYAGSVYDKREFGEESVTSFEDEE